MNRDTAVGRIQARLTFRTDRNLEIIDALQDAQDELEGGKFLPWFLESDYLEFDSTIANEERVPLPENFLREVEGDALWYYRPDATDAADVWKALTKGFIQFLRVDLPGVGPPQAYGLDAEYFLIFPTPDDAYRLRMKAYVKDLALTSNIENNWLKHAHDLMIGLAGIKIAMSFRDKEALKFFAAMEITGRNRLEGWDQAREAANFRYVMGGVD